jgi:hypothetical protein
MEIMLFFIAEKICKTSYFAKLGLSVILIIGIYLAVNQ